MSNFLIEILKLINKFIFLATGMINLTKNNNYFKIMSDCESVHVLSTKSLTKKDHVIVEGIQYHGQYEINQVVSTNFTISMKSQSDISLNFKCTEWGEWQAFDDDGTCRTHEMGPSQNWKTTKGHLRYKRNETCRKFLLTTFCCFIGLYPIPK